MEIKEQIAALEQRREELERIIQKEQHRPSPDDLLIRNLKRRKLRLKDKLAELDR